MHLHDAEQKERSNGKLLGEAQAQLEHLGDGQGEDDDVDEEMGQDGAKEKGRVLDVAAAAERVIPVGGHGRAAKDGHEDAHDEPGDGDDEEDHDGDTDGRVLEQAPVEGQDGQLGCAEGARVADGDEEAELARVVEDLVVEGEVDVVGDYLAEGPRRAPCDGQLGGTASTETSLSYNKCRGRCGHTQRPGACSVSQDICFAVKIWSSTHKGTQAKVVLIPPSNLGHPASDDTADYGEDRQRPDDAEANKDVGLESCHG